MDPFTDDENAQEQEPTASEDKTVVTGSAPYDAADEDDFEED